MSILEVNDLSVTLSTQQHKVYAVDKISFALEQREILGVVGESGSGKTQAMLALLGLTSHDTQCHGEALYQGRNLLALPREALQKIRGTEIAMIFQDPMSSLNPYLRISTQLTEAVQFYQRADHNTARRLAIDMLEKVQIPDAGRRVDYFPHQFSGGMRQRIMIAMALLRKPKILIADEPTTALDVTVQAEILSLLKSLRDDFALSIIFITHDMATVAGTCDRVIVMYAGRIAEQALVDDLFYATKHPYTKGLLRAAQGITSANAALYSIPGNPPRSFVLHPGCAFASRCDQRLAHCETQLPSMMTFQQPAHRCACHLYD